MPRRSEPVLRQRIFEARYERGYRYLDRCGDALLILESSLGDLTGRVWLPGEMVPTRAQLKCPDLDLTIGANAQSMSVDQVASDELPCPFEEIAATALATIIGRFDLREMRRFGFRRIKLLPVATDALKDAEALSLKVSPVEHWFVPEDASFEARAFEHQVRYELPDRRKGLSVATKPFAKTGTSIEVDERLSWPPHHLPEKQRQALLEQLRRQKKREHDPEAGIVIDIDYYWMWPEKGANAKDFLAEAVRQVDCAEQQLLKRWRPV